MKIDLMGFCRLTAVIAEVSFKMLVTVFAGGCHILNLLLIQT
jgi:hypothetical protein